MTQIRLIFADFFQIYPRKSANICVISVLIKKCKGKNATLLLVLAAKTFFDRHIDYKVTTRPVSADSYRARTLRRNWRLRLRGTTGSAPSNTQASIASTSAR